MTEPAAAAEAAAQAAEAAADAAGEAADAAAEASQADEAEAGEPTVVVVEQEPSGTEEVADSLALAEQIRAIAREVATEVTQGLYAYVDSRVGMVEQDAAAAVAIAVEAAEEAESEPPPPADSPPPPPDDPPKTQHWWFRNGTRAKE